MVLLVERLSRSLKLSSMLENHHHHRNRHRHKREAWSAPLQVFEAEIRNGLIQLSLHSEPRPEILTLSWIRQCIQLLPNINKAFVKLVLDIDYPISRWELSSIEDYLQDSLKFLEFLNLITSSVSHLGQARLSLSHALSLLKNSPSLAIERLQAIQPLSFNKNFGEGEEKEDRGELRCCSGKEWVIHQALTTMKRARFWVFRVVVSSLCGDVQSCLEMREAVVGLVDSSLMDLLVSVCEEMVETGGVLKEVSEVNKGVAKLLEAAGGEESSDVAEELQGRVEMLGKQLEGVGDEVDRLFPEVLLGRNNLLNSLQQRKQ